MPSLSLLSQVETAEGYGQAFYKSLPTRWRREDHTPLSVEGESEELKFAERFFRIFGSTYDDIRERYIELLDWYNPTRAPEAVLSYLAQNLGWSLNDSLAEDLKRLLIKNLNTIYNLAGRTRGLFYIIYVHTGIAVRVIRDNDHGSLYASYTTYTTSAYDIGDTKITVADVGSDIQVVDRI